MMVRSRKDTEQKAKIIALVCSPEGTEESQAGSLWLRLSLLLLFSLFLQSAGAQNWVQRGLNNKVKEFKGGEFLSEKEEEVDRRGKITIRRVQPIAKYIDWDTDPSAIPSVLYQINRRTEMPVYVNNEGLKVATDPELYEYPIIYLTAHTAWHFTEQEARRVRDFLKRGGTLWLDECQFGGGPFTEVTEAECLAILPEGKMETLSPTNPKHQDLFKICYQFSRMPAHIRVGAMEPFRAMYFRGRPAIIFCPNDYGCDWEVTSPPTALNPLGDPAHATHKIQSSRENVYKFTVNWLLFTLTH
jgi:hypothetical protein